MEPTPRYSGAHPNPAAWLLVAAKLQIGDLFQALTLVAEFRRQRGPRPYVRLAVKSRAQAGVAACFSSLIDELIEDPALPEDRLFWAAQAASSFDSPEHINPPVILHPSLNSHLEASWIQFALTAGHNWMDFYRFALGLEPFTVANMPVLNGELRRAAEREIEDLNIVKGRSVILCPYAQSFGVHENGLPQFADLARRLTEAGMEVVTNIAGSEKPVAGTRGVSMSIPAFIVASETAGWTVAVRSGLADVLAAASCRKTIVYRTLHERLAWGVGKLDLCRGAEELVFDFRTGSAEAFTQSVLGPAEDTPYRLLTEYPPQRTQRDAGWTSCKKAEVNSYEADKVLDQLKAYLDSPRVGPGCFHISGVPPTGTAAIPPWLQPLVQYLCSLSPASRFGVYSFDPQHAWPFFEHLSGRCLSQLSSSNRYRWSSLLVTVGDVQAELIEQLSAGNRYLAHENYKVGDVVTIGSPTHDDALFNDTQVRPLKVKGVLLQSGWYAVESWGVWSKGRVSFIRLTLEELIDYDLLLSLGARAALSENFPRSALTVSVNGKPVERLMLPLEDAPTNRIRVRIAGSLLAGQRDILIGLELDEVRSPEAQGFGSDRRELGIGLSTFCVSKYPSET